MIDYKNSSIKEREMNPAKKEIILKIKNLFCQYTSNDKRNVILDNIGLDLKVGEIIGIVGQSGSGKTSLLNAISGIDQTSKGEIVFEDKNILTLKEKELAKLRNSKMGIIFQQYHLLSEFNVLENITLPALVYGKDKKKIIHKALELLWKVGIKEKSHNKIGELSGGEMQRVAIARAMINDPILLLADEPTGNLDDSNADIIFDILKSVCQEKKTGVLFVSHSKRLIKKCNQKYLLKKGKLELTN